jgi:tRNA(Arg) A34 adenosine deaminase TadA
MCSAAHAWVGLGRIVYVASAQQFVNWLVELGVSAGPVRPLSITEGVPGAVVDGPVPGLAEEVHELVRRFHRPSPSTMRTA